MAPAFQMSRWGPASAPLAMGITNKRTRNVTCYIGWYLMQSCTCVYLVRMHLHRASRCWRIPPQASGWRPERTGLASCIRAQPRRRRPCAPKICNDTRVLLSWSWVATHPGRQSNLYRTPYGPPCTLALALCVLFVGVSQCQCRSRQSPNGLDSVRVPRLWGEPGKRGLACHHSHG